MRSTIEVCVVTMCLCMVTGSLFHEDSRVVIAPNQEANYFGYSLLLRNTTPPQLVVGAPTATSTHAAHEGLGSTGAIYTCSLNFSISSAGNPSEISCSSVEFDTEGNTVNTNGRGLKVHHYKNEMWLGAALADVSNESLVMCAPRWANQVETERASHRLVNGLCYVSSGNRAGLLVPLADMGHQAYVPSGPEYGGIVLNYFAYGQAGFSAKVSPDQNWLLLGAPGLLQWTGGVAKYSITHRALRGDVYFGKQPITNPYFTAELEQDSYFGYSVDAGVFEKGGAVLGVGGAPRGRRGLGQVLVFDLKASGESSPMRVKAMLTGTQLGSYFGGTLLVSDINADGRADLLVGAPLYADKNLERMPYDQGVVYVYLNRAKESGFTLEMVGKLTGSGASGARFGSALADLGDVDDANPVNYPEIAIGAPWESDGRGAVYIYKSASTGVLPVYVQKITSEHKGFGFSFASGLDVDRNGCNDLVIGALNSNRAVLYRCTRSVHVTAEIKVPGALDLPENATDFTAEFCVTAARTKQRPPSDHKRVFIGVIVSMSVDIGGGRATLTGDPEYTEPMVEPGQTYCKERHIVIHPNADLTRPIPVAMTLSATSGNPPKGRALGPGVRLGASSQLSASLDVQLTRDCGEDLVCQPDLRLNLSSISKPPYVPGSGERLGAMIHIINEGEPAYGACVKISLPGSPLRVPSDCRLNGMELTCELQRPFYRRAEANWTLEVDDSSSSVEEHYLVLNATIHEQCSSGKGRRESLTLQVVPQANVTVIGNALPNATLIISSEKLAEGGDFDFGHFYAVTNFGPSDLKLLEVEFLLPKEVSLVEEVTGCVRASDESASLLRCAWSLPARRQHTALLLLRMSLGRGDLQKQDSMNITTIINIKFGNKTLNVSTQLSREPSLPLWPIIVGVLVGLLLVAAITFLLYKRNVKVEKRRFICLRAENLFHKYTSSFPHKSCIVVVGRTNSETGFFGRSQRARLDKLKQDLASKVQTPGSMQEILIDEEDAEVDCHSREPSPLSDFYAVQ